MIPKMKTIRTLIAVAVLSSMMISCTKQLPILTTEKFKGHPLNNPKTTPVVDSIPLYIDVTGFYGNDELVTIQLDGEEIFRATSVGSKHYYNFMQPSQEMVEGNISNVFIRNIAPGQVVTVFLESGSDSNGKEIQVRKDASMSADILSQDVLNSSETFTRSFTADKQHKKYWVFILTRV
jgi:hypothetical protein